MSKTQRIISHYNNIYGGQLVSTSVKVKKGLIEKERTEAIIVSRYQDVGKVDGAIAHLNKVLRGRLRTHLRSGEFQGKLNQVSILHINGELPAKRIVLVGLGKKTEVRIDSIRQAMGTVSKAMRLLGVTSFTLAAPEQGIARTTLEITSQAMIEGCLLGLYQFKYYQMSREKSPKPIRGITLLTREENGVGMMRAGAQRACVVAEAVNSVRDLCNHPSNVLTPSALASEARTIAKARGIRCTILDRVKTKKLGMGAYLGVARGSHEPPQFIVLEYTGVPRTANPIVLVGKAVTFDTGGISLKPSENMERMKADMTGGAIVLQTIRAIAKLKLPLNVVGIIPATENMPGGLATKPGDILTSLSGKTIEVLNTDAEGRLILADGLAYAMRYKPAAVIDIATLTGAVFVALGRHAIGVLGNDDALINRVKRIGEFIGERAWQLPLWDEYKEQIKSDVADVRNIGGRGGGTITAAAFLSHFVDDGCPWVHLDIAGTDWGESARPYIPKGPTGIGARLIIELLQDLAGKPL